MADLWWRGETWRVGMRASPLFNVFRFHADFGKNGQNNSFCAANLGVGAALGNSGSATDDCVHVMEKA